MRVLLFFASFVILFLLITVAILLFKIKQLKLKINDNDQENIWHELALTDGLTGIYNRTAYNNYISEVRKNNRAESLGIILFDIDDFKKINDTKGHYAGDEVLKFVAKTLMLVFSPSRCDVYRIGGDEFAVLARGTTESEIIQWLIALKRTLENESDIRLSNGYSVIKDDIDLAFKHADEMLYVDKTSHKIR